MPQCGKWQAYITYKGKRYSLGCYADIEDAVKARARGKELVQADAMGLMDFFKELHKLDAAPPSKSTEPKRDFPRSEWQTNDRSGSAAKRMDNTCGKTFKDIGC